MSRILRLPYDARLRELRIEVSRGISRSKLLLPSTSVDDILSAPIDIRLVDLDQVDGNTTLHEQVVVVSLAKQRQAKSIFEFGTFDGKTSANLAANLPDAEILTIDLPAALENSAVLPLGSADRVFIRKEKIVSKLDHFPRVTKLCGDTAGFDFSRWYGTRDFVFIDACHEYEYVINDSEIALRLVKPGGVILWHDYGEWVGVTRALNELVAADQRFRGLVRVSDTTLALLIKAAQS